MHKVADRIERSVSIPFLHLADATAAAVLAAGVGTVGLLGTAFTMEQDFYRDRLASHGLTVLVPEDDDRAVVHRVIYDELVLGVVSDSSRSAYREVMARLVSRGAEGIILGCTEIELLVGGGRHQRAGLPHDPAARRGRSGAGARGAASRLALRGVLDAQDCPGKRLQPFLVDRLGAHVAPAVAAFLQFREGALHVREGGL